VVILAVFGTACAPLSDSTDDLTSAMPAQPTIAPTSTPSPPEQLAFVEPAPSDEFCETTSNIWMHAAALDLIGQNATAQMNDVALANVAEWLERATLFEEADSSYDELFAAFQELQATVGAEFDNNWHAFTASDIYASSEAAQAYELQQVDVANFINDSCEATTVEDLIKQAQTRAQDLNAEFGVAPGSIVPSDTVPKYSIYTHSTGRLIVTFPTHWIYEEVQSDAVVEFVAGEDTVGLLANKSADGVRLRLLPADSVDEFATLLADTLVARECTVTGEDTIEGSTRVTITQTYSCDDHGATLIGQYSPTRNVGLLIEAGFDQPEPTSGDINRLSTIANSALWS